MVEARIASGWPTNRTGTVTGYKGVHRYKSFKVFQEGYRIDSGHMLARLMSQSATIRLVLAVTNPFGASAQG